MFKPGDRVIALKDYDNLIFNNASYVVSSTKYVKWQDRHYVLLEYPAHGCYIPIEKLKHDIKLIRKEKLNKICSKSEIK